ncbi:DNA replication regulator SLD3-domain-containing protein [Kalaharituber pfeilii]|nr:DNA replication regulator SLD3-domain-containing protein [Kalaharituber pfeilii]
MATAASVSRKRKRDEERVLLGDPFVIQPHPSSVFDTSIKITPAVLLPRKCIPLNWLSGVPARLFSANIPALSIPGHVLVIKTDGERQLSAVERISEEAYTLYKLSPNVKMKEVRKLAQLTRKSHSPSPEVVDGRVINSSADWWAGLLMERLSLDKDCSKGRSVVLSMIHPSKAKLELAKSQSPQSQNLRILSPPAETAVFREPTATEFLEQIRTQYLDALYVAKTAIAYFAKSTLSRARVRFQQEPSDSTAPPPLSSLVDFLQDMLLPLDKMDLKYRKVLVQVATEETVEDKSIFKTEEEVYIHRWLNMNFKDKLLQSNDPGLKRQSEELKIRE